MSQVLASIWLPVNFCDSPALIGTNFRPQIGDPAPCYCSCYNAPIRVIYEGRR